MTSPATPTRDEKLAEAKALVEAIAVERWEHAHPDSDRMPTKEEARVVMAQIVKQYFPS